MLERRRFARQAFTHPVSVNTSTQRDRAGIACDLSATGLLFHSGSPFTVGEQLVLMFRTGHKVTSTTGHVVRTWLIEDHEVVLPHAIAVEFEVANLDLVD